MTKSSATTASTFAAIEAALSGGANSTAPGKPAQKLSKTTKAALTSGAITPAPDKSVQKPGKPVTAAPLTAKLECIASEIAGALQETFSLSETLGEKAREAGLLIAKKPEMVDPFIDAVRQLCSAVGLTEGSLKVYMSQMRGVLRAMADGWKPAEGMGLRAMYDAAPKGTGRQKATGPRQQVANAAPAAAPSDDDAGDDDSYDPSVPPAATAKQTKAEIRRAAIVALFGHYDDSLDALIDYIAENETKALRWVEAEVKALRTAAPIRKAA